MSVVTKKEEKTQVVDVGYLACDVPGCRTPPARGDLLSGWAYYTRVDHAHPDGNPCLKDSKHACPAHADKFEAMMNGAA